MHAFFIFKIPFCCIFSLAIFFFVDTADLYVNFQGSLCPVGGNSWRPHWLEEVFTLVKFLTFVFWNFGAVLLPGTMTFFTSDHLQWWHILGWHSSISLYNHRNTQFSCCWAQFEDTHCDFPLAFNLLFMIFAILLLIRPLLSSEKFTIFIAFDRFILLLSSVKLWLSVF